jgi:predicted transposase
MFVSLQFKLELKKEDKEKLIKLMRKQSSAIRVAYNMLKELEEEKTKNPHAQKMSTFGIHRLGWLMVRT